MQSRLRILLRHDGEDDLLHLREGLVREGLHCTLKIVRDDAALDAALREEWDAIVYVPARGVDLSAVLRRIERSPRQPSPIVLREEMCAEHAMQALHAGAADCICPMDMARLADSIRRSCMERRLPGLTCRVRRKLLDTVMKCTLAGVFITDEDGEFLFINDAAVRMLGLGGDCLKCCPGADLGTIFQPETSASIMQRLRGEGEFRFDTRIHAQGGHVFPVEGVLSLVEEAGQAYCIGAVYDVADRRAVEIALEEKEERYRRLFEDCPISLWEEDLSGCRQYFDALREQGVTDFYDYFRSTPQAVAECARRVKILNVNKASLDLLEARSKDELMQSLGRIVSPASLPVLAEEFGALASGETSYDGELDHVTLKGSIRQVEVHFRVAPENVKDLRRVVVSLLDVTERRTVERQLRDVRAQLEQRVEERTRELNSANARLRAEVAERRRTEESLRRSEAALREAQSIARLSTWEYDPVARRFHLPREVFVLFGYPANDDGISTEMFLQLVHPGDRDEVVQSYYTALEGKQPYDMEFRLRRCDGGYRWVHVRCRVRHREQDGTPIAFGTVQDITDSADAREQIRHLSQELIRVQEIERQRMSLDLHDNVAQTLLSIKLASTTLFDDYEDIPEELRRRLARLSSGLQDAINSVRDLSYDLRPPLLDQFGLARSLELHCRELQDKTGVSMDFAAAGMDNVRLDSEMEINLYRLVQEALRNAVNHAKARNVAVRIVSSSPDILLRVEDDGMGFDLERRRTLALRERRMGLSSMEERARLVGGSLTVKSQPGMGTKILAEVPVRERQRAR